MSKYVKRTFENTNVIDMSIFMLKSIKENLDAKGWNRSLLNGEIVRVSSSEYPYCWDAIKLIQKHLSDDVWECKMTSFLKTTNNTNYYTWSFKRKK